MTFDIYNDEEEKKSARESLPVFDEDANWKLIVRALDQNIEYLTEELIRRIESKRDFESLEQLYFLQDRIDYLKQLKKLPKTLYEASLPEPDAPEDTIY